MLSYIRRCSNTLGRLLDAKSQNGAKGKMRSPTAIDLFCGCGGLSSGLRLAGFSILAGVDVDAKYISTFTHNFPEAKSLLLDLTELDPREFLSNVGIERGELDLLAGGPPCQGFSKNVPRKFRFLEDERNLLIKTFLDYLSMFHCRP